MSDTTPIEKPLYLNAHAFRTLAPVFFYFGIAGVATVMLGPLLPALIARWQIQDAQAGTLFTASFTGQLIGAYFAVHRLRLSVISGAILTAAGCAAMAIVPFSAAHVALFCVGLGLGAGLTAGNVITGTFATSSRSRLLAILNVAWSIGAIACPILVRACGPSGVNTFFYLTAAALLAAALAAFAIPHEMPAPKPEPDKPGPKIPLSPAMLFAFAAAMLLYVGVENSLGGWLPSYAVRVNPASRASTIAFYFWTAELIGRLLMATPLNRFRDETLYRLAAALLILTQALLILVRHLAPNHVIALTILGGLAIAPLYPLILAFLFARTGKHPRLGPLFAAAALGGATLPWFTGIVSTHFLSLRAGLAVPAIGTAIMLLLAAAIIPPAKSAA